MIIEERDIERLRQEVEAKENPCIKNAPTKCSRIANAAEQKVPPFGGI